MKWISAVALLQNSDESFREIVDRLIEDLGNGPMSLVWIECKYGLIFSLM